MVLLFSWAAIGVGSIWLVHSRGVFRSDDDNRPLIARLAEWITLVTEILLGHRVDEVPIRVRLDPLDRAPHLQVAIGVRRVDDREGDTRLAPQVPDLLLMTGHLGEPQERAIPVE